MTETDRAFFFWLPLIDLMILISVVSADAVPVHATLQYLVLVASLGS